MRRTRILGVTASAIFLIGTVCSTRAAGAEEAPRVRVAAYNVQFGKWCTPEQVGEMFKEYDFDVIGFGEVPKGDWTARVGKVLGMKHVYVGKHSPYNYKDKYKSLLSRTPLENAQEHHLGHGWSAVHAKTTVRGITISVYSLHIGGTEREGCQRQLAKNVLPKDKSANIIMMGDFNATVGKSRQRRKTAPMQWLLKAGMRPAWKDLKLDVDKHYTYSLHKPGPHNIAKYGVIDHVLIGPKSRLRAVKGGMIEMKKPLSDHKPVWAELAPAAEKR